MLDLIFFYKNQSKKPVSCKSAVRKRKGWSINYYLLRLAAEAIT